MTDIAKEQVPIVYQSLQQKIIDILLLCDNSESIIKIYHPIEIRIEGRPLSFQNKNKQNKNKHEKFKEKILEKLDQYDYFITNRVQIEIELYVEERTLYEDYSLLDTDNISKNLIDILHQSFPRSILIEDTQVDRSSAKRSPKLRKPGIYEDEHFLIRIFPSAEDVIFAIKKNEIIFLSVNKDKKPKSKLYYPVPKNSQEIITQTINLFDYLNKLELAYIRFWLHDVPLFVKSGLYNFMRYVSCKMDICINTDTYMQSMAMVSGIVFPSRILKKGFKVIR